MYKCTYCNYQTGDKTGFSHHNKTKKHIYNKELYEKKIKEEEEKIIREKLLKDKNEKIVIEKQTKEIEELKQKIAEIETIKIEKEKELIIKDKEITKLETEAKIYKELSEKGKNTNNGIIVNGNLNYVNKHFKDAPPLKKITDYKLNGIDMDDDTKLDKLVDEIVYFYNNNNLHKLIGDHIIKLYKKEDLKQQSFHTIDVSRRKYLVKLEEELKYIYSESDELDNSDSDDKPKKGKNKSKWINDNNGIKLSYLLFDPMTKKVIKLLKTTFKKYNDELKKNSAKGPTTDEIKKFEVLTDISKEIDDGKLKKNINNYIAPYFVLDKK